MIEIDPKDEVYYRLSLAREHLEYAHKRMTIKDYPGVVMAAQLSIENAAKAVIAHVHVPSWTHDPSAELDEIANVYPEEVRPLIKRLSQISSHAAAEHGRTTYGIPWQRVTPSQLYGYKEAEEILNAATKALEIAVKILSSIGYKV